MRADRYGACPDGHRESMVTADVRHARRQPDVVTDVDREWVGWDLDFWARICFIRLGAHVEATTVIRGEDVARVVTAADLIYFANALIDLADRALGHQGDA